AYAIRGLGIELFNEHGMLKETQRITSLLQELFGELLEVSEKLEEDASTIDGIVQQVSEAQERQAEWARDIRYEAEIGLFIKQKLRISADGVEWKGRRYPLESITRVRWGGIRHSVNGIPTGTSYTVAFGDHSSEATVQ